MAILRHPTLEGWFLALEQQALPPHTLSPVLVKLLAAQFSAGVLQLLVACAPILRNMGQLGLLARYLEAITQSVLRELRARSTGRAASPAKSLLQLEALRELHPYMEGAQLRELTLALLALPEAHLQTQPSAEAPERERQLSILGKTLVQLLACSPQDRLQSGELLWSSEYVRGLGTLLPMLAVDELDTVFLHTLQRDPVLAPVVAADLLDYCLAWQTPAAVGIATLLLQQSCTHVLWFEQWCSRAGAGHRLQKELDNFLPLIHVYLQHRPQWHFSCPAGGMGVGNTGSFRSRAEEGNCMSILKPCCFVPWVWLTSPAPDLWRLGKAEEASTHSCLVGSLVPISSCLFLCETGAGMGNTGLGSC